MDKRDTKFTESLDKVSAALEKNTTVMIELKSSLK
jgi:hypothetical protein